MRWTGILGLWIVLSGVAVTQAQAQNRPGKFSDANVAKAIKKGVDFLLKQQGANGAWPAHGNPGGGHYYPYGPTAMATYAILESDLVKVSDPRIKKALDGLARAQVPANVLRAGGGKNNISSKFCHKTYSLGLRANAFLAAIKRSAIEYRKNLRSDVYMLVKSTKAGSYGYDCFGDGTSAGDNSNSQYGVLGVWAGVQADEEVPRDYWYKILRHWVQCQNGDGGWSYRATGGSTATMCTAGLASMFLCYDNLLHDGFIKCDQGPKVQAVLRPLNKGLDWMDRYYQKGGSRGIGSNYYLLYGVERVGLASGYKYFGKTDWYKHGAEQLLNAQGADGGWSGGRGAVVNTSYALLFLVRGRHAILFNKLDFEGDWNNRPRDMASLTRVIGKQFEESTLNWQIVNLKVQPEEWLDAPILYISASTDPNFSDAHIAAIRRYVNMGGTILSCTECNGQGFFKGIREAYKKMFPKYELQTVDPKHRFYDVNFKLDNRTSALAGLQMIHNGIRPLVLHTDRDLPRSWQLRMVDSDKTAFTGPANLALYLTDGAVADKGLAARGATVWPAKVKAKPKLEVDVARLKFHTTGGKEGNFDPEPLAWERFSRLMAQKHQVRVNVSKPMAIANLTDANTKADVAVLCGTDRLVVNDEELKALTDFVAGGGLLYVEAAGGAWTDRNGAAFADSAENVARQIGSKLPDTVATRKSLRRLTVDSPVFSQKGIEIREVKYRKFSKAFIGDIGANRPQLKGILNTKSMPALLFSDLDITGGLVGYACMEIHGYRPESAFELMRNIVMTRAHKPREPEAPSAATPGKGKGDKKNK